MWASFPFPDIYVGWLNDPSPERALHPPHPPKGSLGWPTLVTADKVTHRPVKSTAVFSGEARGLVREPENSGAISVEPGQRQLTRSSQYGL